MEKFRSRGPRPDQSTTPPSYPNGVTPNNISVLGSIINAEPIVVGPPLLRYFDQDYATFRANNSARPVVVYQGVNAQLTIAEEYLAAGFSRVPTDLEIDTLQSAVRWIERALQIEAAYMYYRKIAVQFDPAVPDPNSMFTQVDLNSSPEGLAVLKAHQDYQEALCRFQLYATALVARQVGAITSMPVDVSMGEWNYINNLHRSAFTEQLQTGDGEFYYQQSAYVTGTMQNLSKTIQQVLDSVVNLTQEAVSSALQQDEVSAAMHTLSLAVSTLM